MRRIAVLVAAAVAGAVVGLTATTVITGDGDHVEPVATARVVDKPIGDTGDRSVLLVWASGSVPAAVVDRLRAHTDVDGVTEVRAGIVGMQSSVRGDGALVDAAPDGALIPLDAMGFDPGSYPEFLPASVAPLFADLADGEVILGETSAQLRRIGISDHLRLAGSVEVTVAGVVDDTLVGAAEIAVALPASDKLALGEVRYVLVAHHGDRGEIEAAARSATGGRSLRIRAPGETPFLRHGDAVLPQVLLKERFGEFAYYPGSGREFEQDPAWQGEHLATAELPLLGRVRCHRSLLTALSGAMSELRDRNLGHLVIRSGFAGCWNPRLVVAGGSVSHHAWGVALDINYGKNPTGLTSVQDERLVEVMERWGFTWGGRWLVPDPAHFEYLRPPDA